MHAAAGDNGVPARPTWHHHSKQNVPNGRLVKGPAAKDCCQPGSGSDCRSPISFGAHELDELELHSHNSIKTPHKVTKMGAGLRISHSLYFIFTTLLLSSNKNSHSFGSQKLKVVWVFNYPIMTPLSEVHPKCT